MYICICNAIKECDLREAAAAVPGTADAIYIELGREPEMPPVPRRG